MTKIILFSILVSFLVLPTVASAISVDDVYKCTPCIMTCLDKGMTSSECATCVTQKCLGGTTGGAGTAPTIDIMVTLGNIVNWLFAILLLIAAIFIIVAAYYFVTASGNPEQVSKARNFVLYALIGVLVAFAARGLVNLVAKIVGQAAPF